MAGKANRIEEAQALLLRLAAGDYAARAAPSDEKDELDALLTSINMLAETLEGEHGGRIEAEARLEDERSGYEQSPGLMVSVDLEALILSCNQTFAERVGLPKEAIVGTALERFHPPESRPTLLHYLGEVAKRSVGDGPELDLQPAGSTGTARRVVLDGWAVVGSKGIVARLRLLYRDVTDERRLERHLRQVQKMEAIGRLAGGIAHDFNNLLTVIQSTVALLLAEGGAPELREDLADIDLAAKRAAELTGQLLTFSRRQLVSPRLTDLNEVLARAERLLRRMLEENIRIVCYRQPMLPAVRVDPIELEQLLLNLAVNARDAMPRGGTLTIETSTATLDGEYARQRLDVDPGHYVMLAISDTGSGIAPEILEHIFEPFFTTKSRGQGTGLGLSTCYGIARQAGGTIDCYSEVGHGTTFKVYLPAVTKADATLPVEPPVEAKVAGTERILLVEDDAMVRAVTRRFLSSVGYDVTAVGSAREAVDTATAAVEPFDLLIADAILADGLGKELSSELEGAGRAICTLFVSGYTENSIVHQGVLEPGIAFLKKPYTPDQLLPRVRSLLDATLKSEPPEDQPGA